MSDRPDGLPDDKLPGSDARRTPSRLRAWLPDTGYLLFAVILFIELFFGSARLINRDLLQYFFPIGETLARAWHGEGSFLWDSGTSMGMPLLARWGAAACYPAHALFAVLPVDTALSVAVILHFPLAATSVRHLALRYTDNPTAAWVAGLSYGFGGYLLSMAGGGIYLYGAALLPLDLLALHRLLERPCLSRVVQLALVVALQVFCADPQTLFYNVIVLWPLVLLLRGRPGEQRRAILGAAVAGVLAVGISFCQLWPAAELAGLSERAGGLTHEHAELWSFQPLRLLEMVVPSIFGGTTPESTFWARSLVNHPNTDFPWALAIHVGLLPLLGLLWLSLRTQRRATLLWGGATLFFLLAAFGLHTPLHRLLLTALPGADRFRYPEKFLVFVSLGLVLLGAMGLGRVLSRDAGPSRRRGWIALGLLGGGLVVLRILCDPTSPARLASFARLVSRFGGHVRVFVAMETTAEAIARTAVVAVLLAALLLLWHRLRASIRNTLLVVLASADLLLSGLPQRHLGGGSWIQPPLACAQLPPPERGLAPLVWRFGLDDVPDSRLVRGLGSFAEMRRCWEWHSLLPNVGVPACCRHLEGYEAARLLAHSWLLRQLAQNRPQALATIFGLQFALTAPGKLDPRQYPVRAEVPELGMLIHQMPGLPYAYAVPAAEAALDGTAAVSRVVQGSFSPTESVVLEGSPLPAGPSARRRVELLEHRPGRVQLESDFAAPGYLVVLETHYPGWRATVDGQPGDLRRANGLFMGLPVPAGRHRVTLAFEPRRQRLGNAVSLLSLGATVLLWGLSWRGRRRRSAELGLPGGVEE